MINLLIGALIGIVFILIIFRLILVKTSGTFIIDLSDPMKDICRLELSENLNDIYEKKWIMLRVETDKKLTQK